MHFRLETALLFNELWRAVFDGLFSKAGTLIDRRKHTYSIPNLVKLATRYGDPDLKAVAQYVDARLKAVNGPLKKIDSWRHEAVAHSSPSGRADVFYRANKMSLNEVADGLGQLEQLLNELSRKALGWLNDTRTGSQQVVQQCLELFACVTNADRE